MPSAIHHQHSTPVITKFTNCRLVRNNRLVEADLWVSSTSGKILRSQEEFYEHQLSPDQIIDLDGRILAPGFIDVQLNGAQGFDFSVPHDKASAYHDGLQLVNRGLIKTGVTSYLPTVTSQRREVYHKVGP
jgi:N-acetylglucosamine-6-phosphate deacetylase